MPSDRVTLGVIGCGHWGPNHVRVFSELGRSTVLACADTNTQRMQQLARRFPSMRNCADYRALLDDRRIDAVVVATPTVTHAAIAQEALRAGKHVLIEKPMCLTSAEAAQVSAAAEETGLVVMVGHVFLFNNGVRKLRETVVSGGLGRILYCDAARTNLGPVRGDVNALYDLGTHDITILNYLTGTLPVEVSALGRCISQTNVEDVCFATLRYADGTLGHIHVSWMNPRKVRTLTVIGERRMAHWDDIDPTETLRVYDKGFAEPPSYNTFGEFHYVLRSADVHLPAIRTVEPLVNQAEAFLDWILTGRQAGPGARDGWQVAAILEAAMRSIRAGGVMVPVHYGKSATTPFQSAARRTVPTLPDATAPSLSGVDFKHTAISDPER